MADATRPTDRWRWVFHLGMGALSALLFTLVALVGDNPKAGLKGLYSDHLSHTSSTILFLSVGTAIYSQPVKALCDSSEEGAARKAELADSLGVKPIDICLPKTAGAHRPLVINWQEFPRPYPPGQLLYFLPEAVLYQYLDVGFRAINVFSILKFALVAHLVFLLIFGLLSDFRPRVGAWIVLGISYSLLMYWSLSGFYDAVSTLGVVLGIRSLRRERPAQALLVLSGALFFHFRALWHLPLFGLAGYRLVRSFRQRRGIGRADAMAVAAALLSAALSLYVFWVLWPYLGRFPAFNAIYYRTGEWLSYGGLTYGGTALLLSATLLVLRFFLCAGYLVSTTLFLTATPQIFPWHSLLLLPMLLVPTIERPSDRRVEALIPLLLYFVMVLPLVFKAEIWPGWLFYVIEAAGLGAS